MEQTMSTINPSLSVVRSRRLPRWSELRLLLTEWRQRARSRRELMSLDDRELWDVGLTRTDAGKECNKPFWHA
jgi:uncharacterized protein YjiS (DUF1127 family)